MIYTRQSSSMVGGEMIYTQENVDSTTGDVVTITTWNLGTNITTTTVDGVITEERPMTPDEILFWQQQAEMEYSSTDSLIQGLLLDFATSQNPDTAPPWSQPTGAHDAYLPRAIVEHNTKKWRNDLDASNVWEPGTQNAGWTDLSPPPVGPQPWVQPEGSHDAYKVGDEVTHNGQTWVSNTAANVWEPGVYGWDVKAG